MIDELRTLADTLSKATPGPWIEGYYDGPFVQTDEEDWKPITDVVDQPDATAICAARNSEALLRQAADELERLRKVVEQAIRVGGFVIHEDMIYDHRSYCCKKDDAPELAAELEARP